MLGVRVPSAVPKKRHDESRVSFLVSAGDHNARGRRSRPCAEVLPAAKRSYGAKAPPAFGRSSCYLTGCGLGLALSGRDSSVGHAPPARPLGRTSAVPKKRHDESRVSFLVSAGDHNARGRRSRPCAEVLPAAKRSYGAKAPPAFGRSSCYLTGCGLGLALSGRDSSVGHAPPARPLGRTSAVPKKETRRKSCLFFWFPQAITMLEVPRGKGHSKGMLFCARRTCLGGEKTV